MPLVPEQHVLTIFTPRGGIESAREQLLRKLDEYPPVKIVSLTPFKEGIGIILTAVVEEV